MFHPTKSYLKYLHVLNNDFDSIFYDYVDISGNEGDSLTDDGNRLLMSTFSTISVPVLHLILV